MEIQETIELLKIGWDQLVESGQMLDVEIEMIAPPSRTSGGDLPQSDPEAIAFDVYQKYQDKEVTQTFQDPQKNGRELMGIKNLSVDEILPAIGRVVNQSLEKWAEAEIEFEPVGATSGKTSGRFKRNQSETDWQYFRTDYRLYFACDGIQKLLETKAVQTWKRLFINLSPPNNIRIRLGENHLQ